MSDGLSDDVSDWGSDFDDDVDEETAHETQGSGGSSSGDIYEVPDGKPAVAVRPHPVPTTVVPEWLNKVADENAKPATADEYIEHVLLPTRATKDEESKNFIETLKRKLSQKNLLALAAIKQGDIINNNKTAHNNATNNNSNTNNNVIVNANNSLNVNTTNNHHPNPTSIVASEISNTIDYGQQIKQIKETLLKYPWFYRVDRSKAELILENYTTDGSFLVRECHHGGPNVPFTLTIRFNRRLFHIQIRLRPDARFALGTLKANEMHFGAVAEMIDTYKKTHLQLHSNGKFFGETKLTYPPIVYSFSNKNNNHTHSSSGKIIN